MIRRLNYTGRKKLKREHTQFFLNTTKDDQNSFDAILQLSDYNLPSDASVFVEAYRQTSWMRFNFGTVKTLMVPPDRRLLEFETPEGILFRVRITATTSVQGKLLAEADQIPLQTTLGQVDNRVPLLPVIPKKLSGQISRVDFEDRPRLEINSEAGNWRQLTREPAFMSMILTYAVKDILMRILYIEDHIDTQDSDDWRSQWLRYARLLPGMSEPPEDKEKYDDWIDDAVSAFGRQNRIMDLFFTFWNREVEL